MIQLQYKLDRAWNDSQNITLNKVVSAQVPGSGTLATKKKKKKGGLIAPMSAVISTRLGRGLTMIRHTSGSCEDEDIGDVVNEAKALYDAKMVSHINSINDSNPFNYRYPGHQ